MGEKHGEKQRKLAKLAGIQLWFTFFGWIRLNHVESCRFGWFYEVLWPFFGWNSRWFLACLKVFNHWERHGLGPSQQPSCHWGHTPPHLSRLLAWYLRQKNCMCNLWTDQHCLSEMVCFQILLTCNIYNWLVVWNHGILFFHILGMSSSQLPHIFQRGRYTTNQFKNHHSSIIINHH